MLLAGARLFAQFGAPALAQPANNATDVPSTATFLWRPVSGAIGYELQLAFDAGFNDLSSEYSITPYQTDVAGLWPDTLYYWRVRAVDSLNNPSDWSAPWSFWTVVTGAPRPTTPVDGAADIPADQITVGFTHPTTPPNGFEVAYTLDSTFRSGVGTTTTNSKSAGLPTQPADTIVYWRVRVAGGATAGPGAWSRVVRFRTAPAPLPQLGICVPLAPTSGIELEDLLISSVWSGPAPGAAPVRYHVQFSTDQTMREITLDIDDVDSTHLTVLLPEGSATWYWHVRAISTDSRTLDGPWSSTATFSIRERVGTALGAPLLLLPPDRSPHRGAAITMAWDSVPGAVAYELELGRDTLFDSSDTIIGAVDRFASFSGLLPNTLYIWRVRALSDSGIGPWSVPFTFSTGATEPVRPGDVTLISPENERRDLDTTVTFVWSPAPNAIAHQVAVCDDSTFSENVRTFGAFDTTATGVLEGGRRWWWRVRGMSEAGPGPWSTVWTFTTATGSSSVSLDPAPSRGSITIVPTPAQDHATLTALLPTSGDVRITVITMRGVVVAEQSGTVGSDRSLRASLAVGALPPGLYRCRVTTVEGESIDTPLVITR